MLLPSAPTDFRSGFVAIVGRPNVGKSTLLNTLIGQKVAIVSPVAQTTRNRLKGILTLPDAQIVLIDTPGIHKPHHLLGETIVKNACAAIAMADLTLLLVDATVAMGKGDRFVADLVVKSRTPAVLGLNKVDALGDRGEATVQTYREYGEEAGWPCIPFSALTGEGVEALQHALRDRLPPGPYYYPPELVTDRPERFIMGELIREQILLLTREEVPHSVAVTIDKVEERPNITNVLATIYVERTSQKGILIGKGGQMLKDIGSRAREQIQKLIVGAVYLELFVKVTPKWRSSRHQLADLGYEIES